MTNPADWWAWAISMLDTIDVTSDPVQQQTALERTLPALEQALAEAAQTVGQSLLPVSHQHPGFDDYDDSHWFQRAVNESSYGSKRAAVDSVRAELTELRKSDDPGRQLAGLVLTTVHANLKTVGLGSPAARATSSPISLGGLPLAEIIWQARNQDQHYNDAKPTHTPTLDCFRVLTSTTPITFGLSGPPDEGTLNDLVKQQSWAPEILNLLGWVTAKAAGAGISSIRP